MEARHVGSTVQFNAAHIFVANPNVYVWRLEAVLPRVDNEPKLSFYDDGRHSESSDSVATFPPRIAILDVS